YSGESSERAFTFSAGVPRETLVRGITVRDGTGADRGGGMLIENSSPRFEDCIFAGNWAYSPTCGPASHGGGAYLTGSSSTFERCVFRGNVAGPDPCSGHGAAGN